MFLRDITSNRNIYLYSNPTPDNSWQSFTLEGKEYLKLEENRSMGNFAEKDRVKFWNQIYKEANLPYIINTD